MTDWWHNRNWRLIQTNLREIDMRDINAEQVVADLQAFQANVLMINAAGIIASYPTKLPFHFQSPYLQGDSLQDIITACHEADIRVIARTDFSKVRRPIYEMHPEWAYLTAEGKAVNYNGDYQVCINGNYQQHYALLIIEELLDTHAFDGIFFNMGGYQTSDYSRNYYGPCHCQACQTQFRERHNLPLPTIEDFADPIYRKYLLFKQETQKAHKLKVGQFIQEHWPHVCIANHWELRQGFTRREANTALDRPLPNWQYSASESTKWSTTNYPAMTASITTVDFIDYPYRHVTVSPHQQTLRLAQNLANRGAPDYYLIGRLDNHKDRSGYAGIKDIYHYHAQHEATYTGLRSKAAIALLDGLQNNSAEYRGWFRILVENHFLFDVRLLDTALDLPWTQYDAVIVPDLQSLSDAVAGQLDHFVAEGGTLILTGQAGFRDENFERRAEPAFKSQGIEQIKRVRTDMRSAYFKLVEKNQFPRLTESDLIYMDGSYVYADYAAAAKPYLQLIPPHDFGPPERCYYDLVSEHPAYIIHPYGQGRTIYLPWLPGRLFYQQGHPNTSDFCADLLAHVTGLDMVGGNLSPMVEVTLYGNEDENYDLLHLVNGSGHFGNSFMAPTPMHDIEISLSYIQEPTSIQGLRAEQAYSYRWKEGVLIIQIPRLDLFEALQIKTV